MYAAQSLASFCPCLKKAISQIVLTNIYTAHFQTALKILKGNAWHTCLDLIDVAIGDRIVPYCLLTLI